MASHEVEPHSQRVKNRNQFRNQSDITRLSKTGAAKNLQRADSFAVPLRGGKSRKPALAQSRSRRVIAQGRLASGHLQYNTTVKLLPRDQLALLLAAPLRCLRTSIRGLARRSLCLDVGIARYRGVKSFDDSGNCGLLDQAGCMIAGRDLRYFGEAHGIHWIAPTEVVIVVVLSSTRSMTKARS